MGRIVSAIANRNDSGLANPKPWLFGGGATAAGIAVDRHNALSLATCYACISINTSLAFLPLITYRRLEPRGKERAYDHPAYYLLHDEPNPEMSSVTLRQTAQSHIEITGNAYIEIERAGTGLPKYFWLRNPEKTRAERKNGQFYYVTWDTPNGQERQIDSLNMLHAPGMGFDGIRGYSPIYMAREAIAMGLAAQTFGGSFYAHGARPAVALEYPGIMKPETIRNLKESFAEKYAGAAKSGETLVLESGVTFKQLTIPQDEAQFIESRKFQREELAAFYGVPPHKVGILDKATFSNIEQQGLEFIIDNQRPKAVRWEQEINRKIFSGKYQSKFFCEHLLDGLARGDQKSRFESYAIGRQWGIFSADDICEMENLNPLPDGQGNIYLTPLNMIPADQVGDLSANQDDAGDSDVPPDQGSGQRAMLRGRMAQAYRHLFGDVIGRVRKRDTADQRENTGRGAVSYVLDFIADTVSTRESMKEFLGEYAGAFGKRARGWDAVTDAEMLVTTETKRAIAAIEQKSIEVMQ